MVTTHAAILFLALLGSFFSRSVCLTCTRDEENELSILGKRHKQDRGMSQLEIENASDVEGESWGAGDVSDSESGILAQSSFGGVRQRVWFEASATGGCKDPEKYKKGVEAAGMKVERCLGEGYANIVFSGTMAGEHVLARVTKKCDWMERCTEFMMRNALWDCMYAKRLQMYAQPGKHWTPDEVAMRGVDKVMRCFNIENVQAVFRGDDVSPLSIVNDAGPETLLAMGLRGNYSTEQTLHIVQDVAEALLFMNERGFRRPWADCHEDNIVVKFDGTLYHATVVDLEQNWIHSYNDVQKVAEVLCFLFQMPMCMARWGCTNSNYNTRAAHCRVHVQQAAQAKNLTELAFISDANRALWEDLLSRPGANDFLDWWGRALDGNSISFSDMLGLELFTPSNFTALPPISAEPWDPGPSTIPNTTCASPACDRRVAFDICEALREPASRVRNEKANWSHVCTSLTEGKHGPLSGDTYKCLEKCAFQPVEGFSSWTGETSCENADEKMAAPDRKPGGKESTMFACKDRSRYIQFPATSMNFDLPITYPTEILDPWMMCTLFLTEMILAPDELSYNCSKAASRFYTREEPEPGELNSVQHMLKSNYEWEVQRFSRKVGVTGPAPLAQKSFAARDSATAVAMLNIFFSVCLALNLLY